MRRIALAIVLSCLTLFMMAQSGIKVNYKGPRPTVADFAWAAFPSLNYEDEEESGDRPWKALENAMKRQSKGLALEEGEMLNIDSIKEGYILWEQAGGEDLDYIFRLEVFCWNELDGEHILIAFNNLASYTEGRPSITEMSGIDFFRYDNTTKRMVRCDPPGFEIKYDGIYELPRIGKDIIYTKWNDDGTTEQKVLRWNGREFNLQSAASRRATTPSSSSSSMQNITITANGVTFTMVAVQGGTFTMGATTEQGNDADDEEIPAHSVTLSDYYIGQTEVTQALWKAVMGNNPSYRKGSNLPVERVSWNDCQQFITKLNQITGRRFRLPTEAEWEYAASGGVRSRGYKYSGSNDIGSVAWYHGNSDDKMHPVGQKQANELGIYDMSGNVYEWCQDWYGYYSDSAQLNPQGPSWANRRVFRGGSWYDGDSGCRVSYRFCYPPRYIPYTHGLRLAL